MCCSVVCYADVCVLFSLRGNVFCGGWWWVMPILFCVLTVQCAYGSIVVAVMCVCYFLLACLAFPNVICV